MELFFIDKECVEFSGFIVSYLQFSYSPPRPLDPNTGNISSKLMRFAEYAIVAIPQFDVPIVVDVTINTPVKG